MRGRIDALRTAPIAGSYKTPAATPPTVVDVDQLVALVAFSFVSSVTPGPNNVLLWASGASFGLRRTMPHVVGTAVGIGAMALAASFGAGADHLGRPGSRDRR